MIETVDAPGGTREYVDHVAVWSVTQGSSRSRVGNRSFEILPGTAVVLGPREFLVAARLPGGAATASMLRIDPDAFGGLARARGEVAQRIVPPQCLTLDAYQAVRRLVDAALRPEDEARMRELPALFKDLVTALLTRLDRKQEPSPEAEPRCLQRVRDMLHDRFGEELSLSDMARESRLSRESLVRKFHAAYGAPPHEYLMHVRVARARTLLARGTPATEAAFACGFCDQSHLNRWFKKVLGVTPGQYARAVW